MRKEKGGEEEGKVEEWEVEMEEERERREGTLSWLWRASRRPSKLQNLSFLRWCRMETSILVSKPWHCWYVEGPSLCISSPASGGMRGKRIRGKDE